MLEQLIESLGLTGTAQEVADALNAETVEVKDNDLYTWAGVALVAGPEAAEGLRLALEANGAGWAVHQLGGSGLQLSHPLTQSFLLQFAQSGVPGAAELAYVGLHYESPYNNAGFVGEVLAQDVQTALDNISLRNLKAQLESAAVDALQAYREALTAWDGSGDPPVLGA